MTKCFEFEVELVEIRPRIWRRFLQPCDASFLDLHRAIQACGWEDRHLWEFRNEAGGALAGLPEDPMNRAVPDAALVPLASHFDAGPGTSCTYVYDLGDHWVHRVSLRRVVEGIDRAAPFLVTGQRAFPPEDCGGPTGYERVAEFVRTGEDPWEDGERELAKWLGDWDPEEFRPPLLPLEGLESAEEEQVVRLFERFLAEREQDESRTIEEFAERHPEHRKALLQTWKGLQWFEAWSRRRRERNG